MTVGSFLYLLISGSTVLLCLYLAWYANRREIAGGRWFALVLLAIAQIAFGFFALSVTSPHAETVAYVFSRLRFLGLAFLAPFFVLFVLEFTGRWLRVTPRVVVALLTLPVITQGVVWLVPDQFFAERSLTTWQGITIEQVRFHNWFWVHVAYIFILLEFVAVPLLIVHARRATAPSQRRAARTTIVGSILFAVLAMSTPLGISPMINLTPVGGGALALIVALAVFRHQMLDVVPLAYDTVFYEMHDMVLVFDEDYQLVRANAAALALFRRPLTDLLGKTPTELAPRFQAFIEAHWTQPHVQAEIDVEIQRQRRYFDVQASHLHHNEQVVGHLVVLRDITERKQAEAEREQLIAELNAYAHTVAHDLKNPLGLMMGYADMLRDADLDPDSVVAVGEVNKAARKMRQIIDELLLLASVRERDAVPISALDMGAIVQETLARQRHHVTEKQASFDLPATWEPSLGYGPWVEEVWVNYISNALKYGGQPPHLALGCRVQDNGQVRYWVTDNGAGISPSDQGRLFERFTQLNHGQSDGYGLGLSIVKRIITKLGGTVGVESAVGAGSTFYFTLPHAPDS